MGVTIKDVAEAAGVSISTVSKVLNGHYSISEKTAERVRGIMREMISSAMPQAEGASAPRRISR